MSDRVLAWAVRGLWALLPFTVWPAIGAALRHQPSAVRTTAVVGAWALWGVVLVAALVRVPVGLTTLRCAAPAVLAAAVAVVFTGDPSAAAMVVAVGWSAVLTAVVFLPSTAIVWVNGPAYPNERRFPLVAPGPLLLGPIEVAWALLVGLPSAAALLLADRHWVLGGVLAVAAVPAVVVLGRALHGLSRRWLVFVPAGIVVHDRASLADPVLFQRPLIASLAPAPGGRTAAGGDTARGAASAPGPDPTGAASAAGSDPTGAASAANTDPTGAASAASMDLTHGAPGLALELRLREAVPLARAAVRGTSETQAAWGVLVTPGRPGAALAYAAAHRVPVESGTQTGGGP